MTKVVLIFLLCLSFKAFAQEISFDSNKNIFLIGEMHFVQEKYDEIKKLTFSQLNRLKKGEKVSFYFELPYSLNYAFSKINENGDLSIFMNWFNHLYQFKVSTPSYFWTDYRDMIIDILDYSNKNGINIELFGIDIELELRRTVFILSSFENKTTNIVDSLLHLDYIENDDLTKKLIINEIDKMININTGDLELNILNTLKESLSIECDICLDRDEFMLKNFIKTYSSDTKANFISLGLDHIVNQHNFSTASPLFKSKYKMDTTNYKSFYTMLENDLKEKTIRIGILSLNNKLKSFNILKPSNLDNLMSQNEREYLEKALSETNVLRIDLNKQELYKNLSNQLDFLIIYNTSHYKWD